MVPRGMEGEVKFLEIRINIYTLKVEKLKVFIAQLSPTLCDLMDCSLPGSSIHGILWAITSGVGSHSLLQGIFQIQESNPGLQADSLPSEPPGKT